ncbi:calcium-binding protein [Streptomyces xanthophaeus]|uniref:calcium-binding protein n=1 Tax=Streptomyces xanthophaeus TaxID=67385 RepID=UPI00398FC2AD
MNITDLERSRSERCHDTLRAPLFTPFPGVPDLRHAGLDLGGLMQHCPMALPGQTGRCAMQRSSPLYPRLAVLASAFVLLFGGLIPRQAAASAAVFTCNGLPATIVGTNGADTLTGTPLSDVIVGLGGNDTISGAGGDDTICAGGGDDTVYGEAETPTSGLLGVGSDTIFGEGGNDLLLGEFLTAVNPVSGGALTSNDTIYGGQGNDIIAGEILDLTIMTASAAVATANDFLDGGEGADTIYGTGRTVEYTLVGAVQAESANNTINGGPGADTIYGSSENLITAGMVTTLTGGRDTINGGDGADNMYGDHKNGNENLFPVGTAHSDTIDGGVGSDTADCGPGTADIATNTETTTNCEL